MTLIGLALVIAGDAEASDKLQGDIGPEDLRWAPVTIVPDTPNLYVSAQGEATENSFGGPMVVEIVVIDPEIDSTRPNVTIAGSQLRMEQTTNGDWRAYVAQSDMAAAANGPIVFGRECSAEYSGYSEARNLYCGEFILEESVLSSAGNIDAVRNIIDIRHDGSPIIRLLFQNRWIWPVIQTFDFVDGQKIDVTYHRDGGPQTINMTYTESMDSYASASLDEPDRRHSPGDRVSMTITDAILNVDPTDADSWTFSVDSGRLYFQLYDEDGNRPELYCELAQICEVPRDRLAFGTTGSLSIEIPPNLMLVDNGLFELGDDQLLVDYRNVSQPVAFVETGPNTGVFSNTDSDGQANIAVRLDVSDSSSAWQYNGAAGAIQYNRPPVLEPIGDKTVTAQDTLEFDVTARDPDGDPLTFTLAGAPAGATIGADGGFSWTPANQDAGDHLVTIIVSDDLSSVAETITIRVSLPEGVNLNPNAPDVDVQANPGVPVQITPQATDPDGGTVTITAATGATKGSVTLSNNIISYTPDPGQSGIDTVTYTVSDGQGGVATGTITITITPINDPPSALSLGLKTPAGQPVSIDLAGLDIISDPQQAAETLALSITDGPTLGTAVVNGTTFTYTPRPDAAGADTIDYTVTDDGGLTDTATITISILPRENRAPQLDDIRDMTVTAPETLAFDVTATDPDGDPLTFTLAGGPEGATISRDGAFSWTPAASQAGRHTFVIVVADDQLLSDSQSITVTVLSGLNAPPQGQNITISAEAGQTVTDDIADILYDPDDDPITVDIAGQPARGMASASGTVLFYTADADSAGSDSFEYRLTDQHGAMSVWTVTVTISEHATLNITNLKTPDIDVAVSFGAAKTFRPDLTGGASIVAAGGATKGDIIETFFQTGSIVYNHHNQSGIDAVTYTLSDGTANATGTVYFHISEPGNAAPTLSPIEDLEARVQDTATFQAQASDPDDNPLEFALRNGPDAAVMTSNGTFSWTPAESQIGSHDFAVTVYDDQGGFDSQNVTAVVLEVPNEPPQGQNITISAEAGQTVTDDISDVLYDPDDDPVTVDIAGLPSKGSVSVSGTVLNYTADAGATGLDSFEYRLTDQHGAMSVWTVTVNITGQGGVSGTIPLAPDVDIEAIQAELTTVQPDIGAGNTIESVTGAAKGTITEGLLASGTIAYTADAGESGIDEVTYTVSGGGQTAQGTVRFYINEQGNERPVLDTIPGMQTQGTVTFTANATDGDDDSLTYIIRNAPDGATMSETTGQFSWDSTSSNPGDYTFNVVVHDDSGGLDWQKMAITVRDPNNDNPTAPIVHQRTTSDTPILATPDIRDPEGQQTSMILAVGADKGSVREAFLGANIIAYIPQEEGTDIISYTTSDGAGGSATSTVYIHTGTSTDPDLDVIGIQRVNASQTLTFQASATDPDGPGILYVMNGGPDGAMLNETTGAFSWTPAASDVGDHTFTITAYDGQGGFDTESVAISVSDPNIANEDPNISDFDSAARQNNPRYITLQTSDPDDDPTGVILAINATSGTVRQNLLQFNIITYVPELDYAGTDTVTYVVSDGRGGTSTGTIYVHVRDPANREPVLQPVGNRQISVPGTLTFDASASDSEGSPLTYAIRDAPDGATIDSTTGAFSWTPTAQDAGDHTFTVTVYDDAGGFATEDIIVTVNDPDSANRSPVAPDENVTVADSRTVILPDINDTDGDEVTIIDTAGNFLGLVDPDLLGDALIAYTPFEGAFGVETITYTVSDGRGGISKGTITVNVVGVTPPNREPTAADFDINVGSGESVTVDLSQNDRISDPDGDPLTVAIAGAPARGTATIDGITITYDADVAFIDDTDTIIYIVSDGRGGTAAGVITVNVAGTMPENSNPTARPANLNVGADGAMIDLADLISDPDGDELTVSISSRPSMGTVTASGTTITYTPDEDATGVDTITYTVSDGKGGTATGTITITITVPPSPPAPS